MLDAIDTTSDAVKSADKVCKSAPVELFEDEGFVEQKIRSR